MKCRLYVITVANQPAAGLIAILLGIHDGGAHVGGALGLKL